jgi:hypothetical protein
MNHNTWEVEERKNGAEIYVSSEWKSIFIGEGYSDQEQGESLCLANVISDALNQYEEEYQCHDRGRNTHFNT